MRNQERLVYILENTCTRPQYNLALEEYLCRVSRLGGLEFFMLWRNEPSVIVGRFQDVSAEINLAFARAHDIPVIRRNSGGGAVYHDTGNVNYSFIMPESPEHGFEFFANRIIRALIKIGARANFSAGRNDIAANGEKISGMAQYRNAGTLLCHGTLLFDCRIDVMSAVLNVPDEKLRRHGVKSVQSRVTNLKPLIPGAAGVDGFMKLMLMELRGNGTGFALSAHDRYSVKRLEEEKYSNPDWNLKGRAAVSKGEDI